MDQKKIEAQVKGKFENLNAYCGPKKKLKARVKGKFENLTANYGPIFFEGPSKRENQKLNCQLWTKQIF